MKTIKRFLTVSEAAAETGYSDRQIRRLCDEGAIACNRRDGGHRRIPVKELAKFIADVTGQDAGPVMEPLAEDPLAY